MALSTYDYNIKTKNTDCSQCLVLLSAFSAEKYSFRELLLLICYITECNKRVCNIVCKN